MAAVGTLKSSLKSLIGKKAVDDINDWRNFLRTTKSADRTPLLEEIIPAFARDCRTILWVGCRRYTASYPARLVAGGGTCWTMDIDPAVKKFGSRDHHRTGDLTAVDRLFPDVRFDAVLCNGVFGYGVDVPEQQRVAAAAMASILQAGGVLLLGWNTDKIEDPGRTGVLAPWFRAAPALGLVQHWTCQGTSHIYDLYIKQENLG
jgi:SAM-dependent methyltransferase